MKLLITLTINGTTHYVSDEHHSLVHQWDRRVVSFDSPKKACSQIYGGLQKIMFGNIELSFDLFDKATQWPPPKTISLKIETTHTTEAEAVTIFNGTAHFNGLRIASAVYELSNTEYTALLLDEVENYDGDIVPDPRAIGVIRNQRPVRLPDVSTRHCYGLGHLDTTLTWDILDDGVSCFGNLTNLDTTNNKFELSSPPVGEVTISGTGTVADFSDFASLVEDKESLSYSYALIEDSASTVISYWADSQQIAMDLLDKMLAAFGLTAYVTSNGELYIDPLISSTDSLTQNGANEYLPPSSPPVPGNKHLPIKIDYPIPTTKISTTWVERTGVEETKGIYVKDIDNKIEITGQVIVAGVAIGDAVSMGFYYGGMAMTFGVKEDMVVKRIDDGSTSAVTSDPTNEYYILIDDYIFNPTVLHPTYIKSDISNGETIEVDSVYSNDKTTIEYNLSKIAARSNMMRVTVQYPMALYLGLNIGQKYLFVDYSLPNDGTDYSIYTMIPTEIVYDFKSGTYIITGIGGLNFKEIP